MPDRCLNGRIASLLLLSLAFTTLAGPATAKGVEPNPLPALCSLRMVGQIGGRAEDVAVQGDYAYVAVGLRLVALDVSDWTSPREIGSTTPFPEFAKGVAIDGTMAYVAAGMAGLRIVDISDPSSPVEVGSYDSPGFAEQVFLAGQYAYLADGHYGLRVVDIIDPTAPVEASYAYPLNYTFDVVVDGDYAYLAAAGAGLLVADVSNPAHPVEVGSLDTDGYAYGVDVGGDTAYVADGWEHLTVADVSDPSQPLALTTHTTLGWAFDVVVVDERAYVADAFGGLRVLDVSDPGHPAELGAYETLRGHAGRVAIAGNTAYVADRNFGVRMVDVSNPSAPNQVGLYDPLSYCEAVAVSGGHAYVAATHGLRVIDVTDPAHPVEQGAYGTQGKGVGVAAAGDFAYMAVQGTEINTGLHVVDVSDPANPALAGFCGPAGMPRDLALVGDMAYIADEWGLQLIDVSSPHNPTQAAHINLMGDVYVGGWSTLAVHVSGDLAFVAGGKGLHVVDVADPASPRLLGHLNTDERHFFYDVAVAGTKAYVTGADNCVTAIDVSDPHAPVPVAVYWTPYAPERLTVANGMAYVAFGSGGLGAVDVADPSNPAYSSSYDTPGYAFAPTVADGMVYVADGHGGLVILAAGSRRTRPTQALALSGGRSVASPVESGHDALLRVQRLIGAMTAKRTMRDRIATASHPSAYPAALALPGMQVVRQPGTCTVTSVADSGPGSLRACLDNAVSGDRILFDPVVFPPVEPMTITLSSGLWIGQGGVTLDASNAGVILDGSRQNGSLTLASDENVVKGLQILNFPRAGVHICCGAKHNVVGGDGSQGEGPTGEGNVISGNGLAGIYISDSGTMHNVVVGNLIGTDAMGTSTWGNGWQGVGIENGASFNRIGGPEPWERNIISGNGSDGVCIDSHIGNTTGNVVVGNYIGTDVSGMAALPNRWTGVGIELGAFNNVVKGNLIAGNDWVDVVILDPGTAYNTVVGNLIGTDVTGSRALRDPAGGLYLGAFGSYTRVGGTSPGESNLIAGGIGVWGTDTLILGNLIGTDIHGGTAITGIESLGSGVGISHAGSRSFVGGATRAERNLISGSNTAGITVSGTDLNFLLGNDIGTDVDGGTALGNRWSGIEVNAGKHTVIQNNVIAGNLDPGVWLRYESSFNQLRANFIGVAADGISPLPNGMSGVSIEDAPSNLIGGQYPEDGNVIAFNDGAGIEVWGARGNSIRRNSIYGNRGPGIGLAGGGNKELAAPTVTHVRRHAVSGSACSGCIVDLYSDHDEEGRVYEGSVVADGAGRFHFTKASGLTGPFITATVTDADGNTSEFSVPVPLYRLWLPVIIKRA